MKAAENSEETCNLENQIPAFHYYPIKRIVVRINASMFITSDATNTYVVGENSLIFGDGMRLIRIELENFKSFGGEITIPLKSGFTAITGPNGSGKSNCGDAIRFVLGPKSTKSLRASNVTELIFNGGKNGKPAKYMSAKLVFSNSPEIDGHRRLKVKTDEASFTRTVRLNRKGDPISSYKINDNPCTATEMRRVLRESGLHGDGYNIVLQGDVTTLATMTPHKRRGVLEEVAGVTAYDEEIRKANSQRKQVQSNIETIEIFETDQKKRLQELEKERNQAIKFKDLKGELDLSKLILEQSKHRNRMHEVELLNEERSRYSKRSSDLNKEYGIGSTNLDELDKKLVKISKNLENILSGDSKKLVEKIRKNEIEIETNRDRLGDQDNIIKRAEDEKRIINNEMKGATEALEDANLLVSKLKEQLSDSLKKSKDAIEDEKQARKAIESGDKVGRELNRELGKASKYELRARELFSEAKLEYESSVQKSQIYSERLVEIEQEYESAELDRDDQQLLGEDLTESNPIENRDKLATDLIEIQKQEKILVEDRDRAESRLRESERSLTKARARQEAQSARPGSELTLTALKKLRDSGEIRGILGTLGELASPKNSTYEQALSFAFGGSLRSIIVEDDGVASKCISWLRNNGGGRATFLPLNKLIVSRPQGRTLLVARNPGIVGFVHDLLDYDSKIEKAIRYAGRNTLVVDSMNIARENMGGVRMVTLDGSIVESSGAMTGGSSLKNNVPKFQNSTGSISIIEKKEKAVFESELVFSTVDSALKELRLNQQEIRDKIFNLDNSDHTLKLRNWRSDLERTQKIVSDLKMKVKKAKSDYEKTEFTKIKLKQELEKSEKSLLEAVEKRELATEKLQNHTPDHLSEKLREAEKTRTEAERIKVISEAEISANNQKIDILNTRVKDLSRQSSEQESIILRSRENILKFQETISNAENSLNALREKASQFDEEHRQLTDKRDSIVEERASLRAHLDSLSQEKHTLSSRIDELNIQIKQKTEAVGEILSQLKESGIPIPPPESILPTVAEAERSVQGLERRLGDLGNVNMLAIEQYENTSARISDLISDGNLLKERRDDLDKISAQLEEERRTRLLTVFKHVNKNFSRVYEILQPTGSGNLKLENPDNPFEGGLEMACVPPGKSQNTRRSALSGGEKSMAALALIFAIQDYEPSPFYYFDEVDQNLDPFNSERIATLCRMRSQMAQFIMVTLRKVSLTLADHHIGITHGGDGRSQRITDFDRAAALELSEEIEKEEEARRVSEVERESIPMLPTPENMPRTPDPLPVAKSIGGLAERAGVEISEEKQAQSIDDLKELRDRAEENNESAAKDFSESKMEDITEEFSEIGVEES